MADTEGGGGVVRHLRWQWYVLGVITGLFLAGIIFSIFSVVAGY